MKRRLQLLLAAVASLVAANSEIQAQVSLRTSWPAPPLYIEVLETVAAEAPTEFFPFLDLLTNPDVIPKATTLTPEAAHKFALEVASRSGLRVKTGFLANVRLQLALHSSTPKIEAFYSFYEQYVNNTKGNACGSWVDWYGDVVCDVETLKRLAGTETIGSGEYERPATLTFDHIHPSPDRVADRPPRTAILYGSLFSDNFRELHTYLYELAKQERVEYVFRHIPEANRAGKPGNVLSGYGVALNLKKTDYLALDDRQAGTKSSTQTNLADKWDPVLTHVTENYKEKENAPNASVPLTEEELAGLGPQAIQVITEGYSAVEILKAMSQDFPNYATHIARRVVAKDEIVQEIQNNSLKVRAGMNMLWINGAPVEPHDVEPLPLLRILKKERDHILSLTNLGLQRSEAFKVLTHNLIASAQREGSEVLYDASDREEGGNLIMYWNDIENDPRYKSWSPTLHSLIRPMYPGQFPSVKYNIFNTIVALDLSQAPSINFITGPISNIVERNLPFRFGIVPIVETEEGKKMARLFYYLLENWGQSRHTMRVLRSLAHPNLKTDEPIPPIDWAKVKESYDEISTSPMDNPDKKAATFEEIISGKIELAGMAAEVVEEKLSAYHKRLGTTIANSPHGHAFFNGKYFKFDSQFLKHLQDAAQDQQQTLMHDIYTGALTDEKAKEMGGMGNYWYDLPGTSKTRNSYIFPATRADLKVLNLPDVFDKAELSLPAGSYAYPENESPDAPVFSIQVLGDFDSEGGLELAKEALRSLGNVKTQSRVTFLPNPKVLDGSESDSTNTLLSKLVVNKLLKSFTPSAILSALEVFPSIVSGEGKQAPLADEGAASDLIKSAPLHPSELKKYIKASRIFARNAGLKPGESGLAINGRVVGPLAPSDFSAADIETLEKYEMLKRTGPVVGALSDVAPSAREDRDHWSHSVSIASSVINWIQIPDPSETGLFDTPLRPRIRNYEQLEGNYTSFSTGDADYALYHIIFLLDPLSETAQKWSGLIQLLGQVPNAYIKVHLNPAEYKEMPIKRFYRTNLEPNLWFTSREQEDPAVVRFMDLPEEHIYTLAMDVPASWLVRPKESRYDLDNIQLGRLLPGDKEVHAAFSLDALLIEGHAREVKTQAPPRGVQLQVVTTDGEKSNVIQDTLVVANLGYFQFRLTPGVFGLEIREGTGRKVYELASAGGLGWNSPSVEEVGNQVALTDFEGVTLFPRLERRPGMATADVLAEEEEDSGSVLENISSKVKSIFKTKKPEATGVVPVKKEQAEINIFTVASGLLYERFASIMILSVLKNTKHTVKFWFIENFLSPSFLEFIPHMAAEYKFDYELVTYRWPSWLREQTEKQRIIWAYKILFLDVLFPMDLKKVIFVDADQIVRADLKELVDLDLQGAPYGYTPMGDDNTEMEGFRFWKTGYWKDFLQGRPYHISALYVVDLVKFRKMAAGDILRGQYQALSADPNSLANLDQDLPNNLQGQVPIFSLDKDWLWCETWCSKDRLHTAKTIDLCQNPMTKEPKLSRARQIPEWEEYDAEIARFTRRLAEEGKISSGLAAADANVLAGGNAEPEASKEEPKEQVPVEAEPEKKEDTPVVEEKKVEEEAPKAAEPARPTDEL